MADASILPGKKQLLQSISKQQLIGKQTDLIYEYNNHIHSKSEINNLSSQIYLSCSV